MIGDGKIPEISSIEGGEINWIEIPEQFLVRNESHALHDLIHAIYPELSTKYNDSSYLKEHGILAPKNADVDELNVIMLSMLLAESQKYLTADMICLVEGENIDEGMHSPELLHSLNFSGIPSHCLELKKGAPIMLLKNCNQSQGLCNGTRLIVEKMRDKVIEAQVITSLNIGEGVFISRIILSPSTTHSSVPIKRRQFLIKQAFAMTINKSQGQTLKNISVLYDALSRVTTPSGLKILIVNKVDQSSNYTKKCYAL
ncbi:ATP-dependent DNA helicase PIF1-like [Camellia sinensis]|uniref:ATP-dependent DNA helicase PIF1-like n=1 Tax=Camellia sinensis TaxID=4442 RepID=UPI0010357220|nr:ATP-dependent DNA helicase PIF1-like [Camellia sinensis]